jgi:hypothetical protein
MTMLRSAALVGLVLAPALTLAQDPAPVKNGVSTQVNIGNGSTHYKGWYLYWPVDALKQPRMPLPYPWWPAQANGAGHETPLPPPPAYNLPANGTPAPLSPLYLPRDSQNLPTLPQSSWVPGSASPFQPVAYPSQVPAYWYGR